ncbi:rhamnan synthesis F family protein [Microbacterium sp. JZ31]|uniref:rhamnan synthesis F family protein n=1 Tax=Microbacterium sp. JZ31 TaxID=1906274 RepID=UPI0019335F73|nr:rhamnan synthesis F family protein [Microbacterium sp. JZ31]
MSLLVVMAHYDVGRTLRRHTLHTISNYAAAADRVVVVSTSGIREEDVDALPPNVDFVMRPNFGYDFFSYKWGLDLVGDYGAYDRIVISNDSFVGPFVPLSEIVTSDAARENDLMGMTWSENHGGHAQSFFVTVSGQAARSAAFQNFWRDMTPVSDRMQVILRYEVGMTTVLADGGFNAGAYFRASRSEQELAKARFRHQYTIRLKPGAEGAVHGINPTWGDDRFRRYNPAIVLADRLLLDARLPLLKFDTLRFDPAGLDAARLLAEAERTYPHEMASVREFLRDTRASYPFRPGEHNVLRDPAELASSGLGYCMDGEFATRVSRGE